MLRAGPLLMRNLPHRWRTIRRLSLPPLPRDGERLPVAAAAPLTARGVKRPLSSRKRRRRPLLPLLLQTPSRRRSRVVREEKKRRKRVVRAESRALPLLLLLSHQKKGGASVAAAAVVVAATQMTSPRRRGIRMMAKRRGMMRFQRPPSLLYFLTLRHLLFRLSTPHTPAASPSRRRRSLPIRSGLRSGTAGRCLTSLRTLSFSFTSFLMLLLGQ